MKAGCNGPGGEFCSHIIISDVAGTVLAEVSFLRGLLLDRAHLKCFDKIVVKSSVEWVDGALMQTSNSGACAWCTAFATCFERMQYLLGEVWSGRMSGVTEARRGHSWMSWS
jgi:hypothetical protein